MEIERVVLLLCTLYRTKKMLRTYCFPYFSLSERAFWAHVFTNPNRFPMHSDDKNVLKTCWFIIFSTSRRALFSTLLPYTDWFTVPSCHKKRCFKHAVWAYITFKTDYYEHILTLYRLVYNTFLPHKTCLKLAVLPYFGLWKRTVLGIFLPYTDRFPMDSCHKKYPWNMLFEPIFSCKTGCLMHIFLCKDRF